MDTATHRPRPATVARAVAMTMVIGRGKELSGVAQLVKRVARADVACAYVAYVVDVACLDNVACIRDCVTWMVGDLRGVVRPSRRRGRSAGERDQLLRL